MLHDLMMFLFGLICGLSTLFGLGVYVILKATERTLGPKVNAKERTVSINNYEKR